MPRTQRNRHTGNARRSPPRAGRRIGPSRWGDLRLDHRIPTFLETLLFEGDDSATSTRRFDT